MSKSFVSILPGFFNNRYNGLHFCFGQKFAEFIVNCRFLEFVETSLTFPVRQDPCDAHASLQAFLESEILTEDFNFITMEMFFYDGSNNI
jgi:hypothetical protein